VQRRGQPEEHGRDGRTRNEEEHHAPVRVRNEQSDISDVRRHAGGHRIDNRLEKLEKGERRGDQTDPERHRATTVKATRGARLNTRSA
jgi:hypothetical protein